MSDEGVRTGLSPERPMLSRRQSEPAQSSPDVVDAGTVRPTRHEGGAVGNVGDVVGSS